MPVHGFSRGSDVQAAAVRIGDEDVVGGIRHRLRACAVVILGGKIVRGDDIVKARLDLRCPRGVALADVQMAAVRELLADEFAETGDEAVWIEPLRRDLLGWESVLDRGIDLADDAYQSAVCYRMTELHREDLNGARLSGDSGSRLRRSCRGCCPTVTRAEEQEWDQQKESAENCMRAGVCHRVLLFIQRGRSTPRSWSGGCRWQSRAQLQ